ncbi:segregation/condensation protein A [Salicibibacter halophilus]|uniref:Segregation and condensation protein A n=1 Tax=Salicibibacter halophilus TaxID=2502791 RepID=A0A514LDK9_9BACI|nr:segregation/condensation protein A [Salicibibacter halophilus]QDI89904.1 segregation/condensation protein A [Salicibibacter halophilus]
MGEERYNVKLDSFEGPLDLLLHLIKQAEVDIYDIPVAQITEQYMAFIHRMQELELDIASEYLVMASTLLAIKSQMLLPMQDVWADEDLEEVEALPEEDPREALVAQLEVYREYKAAAAGLAERQSERARFFSKAPSKITPSSEHRNEPAMIEASLSEMLQAYQKLKWRLRVNRPRTTTVETQKWTIEDKMQTIRTRVIDSAQPLPFLQMYTKGEVHEQVISFMALLQLMKENAVVCNQRGNFAAIYIQAREETNHE